MKYASVCSGIESASVAWHDFGWSVDWFAEIEPFPSAVLAHHYPAVHNLGDMTCIADLIMTGEVSAPDVLVGGTPCQSFSHAGLRAGLSDHRGALTLEYVRIANAIDAVRSVRGDHPCITVWENVPGVLTSRDNAFGCFLGALAGEDCDLIPTGKKWTNAGIVLGPKRAIAWRVLNTQFFGLPQRRCRVFAISSAREGFNPAKILFEPESVRRNSATSGKARKKDSGRTEIGAREDCQNRPRAYGRNNCSGEIKTTSALTAHHGRDDFSSDTFIGQPACFALAGNTIGRGPNAVSNGNGFSDICYTLTSTDVHAIAEIIAFDSRQDPVSSPDVFGALGSSSPQSQSIATKSQVRRLTPIECERLQGFPDNWTLVPWHNGIAPDTLRYKAVGNSMSVPVMRWTGQRIAASL